MYCSLQQSRIFPADFWYCCVCVPVHHNIFAGNFDQCPRVFVDYSLFLPALPTFPHSRINRRPHPPFVVLCPSSPPSLSFSLSLCPNLHLSEQASCHADSGTQQCQGPGWLLLLLMPSWCFGSRCKERKVKEKEKKFWNTSVWHFKKVANEISTSTANSMCECACVRTRLTCPPVCKHDLCVYRKKWGKGYTYTLIIIIYILFCYFFKEWRSSAGCKRAGRVCVWICGHRRQARGSAKDNSWKNKERLTGKWFDLLTPSFLTCLPTPLFQMPPQALLEHYKRKK